MPLLPVILICDVACDPSEKFSKKYDISQDLGLSRNCAPFLYFFQLQVLTVFWAGLGWPGGQLMTDWLEYLKLIPATVWCRS